MGVPSGKFWTMREFAIASIYLLNWIYFCSTEEPAESKNSRTTTTTTAYQWAIFENNDVFNSRTDDFPDWNEIQKFLERESATSPPMPTLGPYYNSYDNDYSYSYNRSYPVVVPVGFIGFAIASCFYCCRKSKKQPRGRIYEDQRQIIVAEQPPAAFSPPPYAEAAQYPAVSADSLPPPPYSVAVEMAGSGSGSDNNGVVAGLGTESNNRESDSQNSNIANHVVLCV